MYLQTGKEPRLANISFYFIVVISLFVSSCVSSLPPPPSTLSASTLEERITAVENRLPVKRWSKWNEKTLVDRMEQYNVPGVSIAVINSDEIEWSKGYGTVEVGSNKSVTPDTLFQSASIGKSLTAAAAMVFVENGYLTLDENVNEKYRLHRFFEKGETPTLG